MEKIIIPVELQLTQHSQAVIDALYKAIPIKFKEESTNATAAICLRNGEHYAGVILDENGNHLHHLALIGKQPENKMNWQNAIDWAKDVGGELPTRQEQSLLFANCKKHLKPVWHWSSEAHEDDASLRGIATSATATSTAATRASKAPQLLSADSKYFSPSILLN